jgi:hypothetical protein
MQILNEVEIAPSAQIHTGQIGTTQIPPPLPVSSKIVYMDVAASESRNTKFYDIQY